MTPNLTEALEEYSLGDVPIDVDPKALAEDRILLHLSGYSLPCDLLYIERTGYGCDEATDTYFVESYVMVVRLDNGDTYYLDTVPFTSISPKPAASTNTGTFTVDQKELNLLLPALEIFEKVGFKVETQEVPLPLGAPTVFIVTIQI